MKFSLDKKEKFTRFQVDEEKLNSLIAPELKSELVLLNAEGIRNIILDLQGVSYVDSSGLSAILIGNRLCKNANGSFALCGLQDSVNKLLTISQLDSILNIFNSSEEASDFVLMEELERDIGKN